MLKPKKPRSSRLLMTSSKKRKEPRRKPSRKKSRKSNKREKRKGKAEVVLATMPQLRS